MAESEETTTEATGSSRRALLAKAAAAGAVVYAVPMVSSIPAYAAAGLSSFHYESGTCCVWFSPNQNTNKGKWHANIASGAEGGIQATTDSAGTQTMTVQVKVNGVNRGVKFDGNPNNPGSEGKGTASDSYFYDGGGVAITSLDSNCEVLIEAVACHQQSSTCSSTNDNAAPTPWSQGSSDNPIGLTGTATAPGVCTGGYHFTGTVYYHTGRTGGGDSNRCRATLLFKVRCKV